MNKKEADLLSLKAILRPVLRFCVTRNLKLQEICDLCKELLVDIASDELDKSKEGSSNSRISVMTGVHRKDVAAFKSSSSRKIEPGDIINRVIGHWRGNRKYCTKSGEPRVLNCAGADSDFAHLVWSVSQEINPYTILFELERIKAVKRKGDTVTLIAEIYIPKGDHLASMRLLEDDYNDLIVAVDENVAQSNDIPNLHIKTEYTNVGSKDLKKIRSWFLREGSAFHGKARKFLSQFDRDIHPQKGSDDSSARVAVVAFSRVEEEK